jgi:hypothetical protein
MFSHSKTCFCFTGFGIHMEEIGTTLKENCRVKKIVLNSEFSKKMSGSESEKKSFEFTTQAVSRV